MSVILTLGGFEADPPYGEVLLDPPTWPQSPDSSNQSGLDSSYDYLAGSKRTRPTSMATIPVSGAGLKQTRPTNITAWNPPYCPETTRSPPILADNRADFQFLLVFLPNFARFEVELRPQPALFLHRKTNITGSPAENNTRRVGLSAAKSKP